MGSFFSTARHGFRACSSLSLGIIQKLFLLYAILTPKMIFSDELCDLVGSTQLHDGKEIIQCLDFASMNGDTLEVSGNVSTIAHDGLALCPLIDINVITPDIVYILDQSGSMMSDAAVVNTTTGDTIIADSKPSGSDDGEIEILWKNSTKKIPLYERSSTSRYKWAGDPYGQAVIALHKAIDYQAGRSKNSTAGYMGFNTKLLKPTAPKSLSTGNVTNLKNNISINYNDYTHYEKPLKQAKEWLLDKDLCNNDRQLIVFISDGAPTDSNKYEYLIDEKMPPIYGIFLGEEGGGYDRLEDISIETGGRFTLVPPKSPDSLSGVIKGIIEESFNAPPVQIKLTNSSLSPAQSSYVDEAQMKQQSDGSWKMVLDSALGVKDGYNDIDVHLKKTEADGSTSDIYYSFTLKVSSSNSNMTEKLEEKCYDMVSLQVENSSGTFVDTLTENDKKCKLLFNVYHKTPLETFPVKVQSLVTKDQETVRISKTKSVKSSDPERLLLVEPFNFVSDDTISHTINNDIVETRAIDTLVFSWTNPRNSKDYVIDTIYVRGDVIIFSPEEAAIYDTNEDGAGDRIQVTFNRSIPKAFEADAYYWNSKSSLAKKSSANATLLSNNVISYDFSTDQFAKATTAEAVGVSIDQKPIVQYSSNQTYPWGDTKVVVTDKMGAIPLKAQLLLSHPLKLQVDTLRLEVSEELSKAGSDSDYAQFIRLVSPDDISSNEFTMYDKSYSYSLENAGLPTLSGDKRVYTFLLKERELTDRGSRLFLERDGGFTDINKNRAARLSVPFEMLGTLHFQNENGDAISEIYPQNEDHCFAVLETESLSDKVDTLKLVLRTQSGDMEQLMMIESNSNSGYFKVKLPLTFVQKWTQNNGSIEGRYSDIHEDDSDYCFAEVQYGSHLLKDTLELLYKGEPIIDPTTIYVKNSNNITTSLITDADAQFTVLLDTYRPEHQESYLLTITSAKHGDKEELTLFVSDSVSSESDTLRLVFGKAIGHDNNNIQKPTEMNGVVETAARDSLFLEWRNPLKGSEIVRDTVVVTGEETTLTVLSATITDSDENGSADRIVVSFKETLPQIISSSEAYWSSMSSLNQRTPEESNQVGLTEIEYLFTSHQFALNQTAISEGLANNLHPRIHFTANQPFPLNSMAVTLRDGVGPVPTKAELYASIPGSLEPDTLVVTLSEKLSDSEYVQLLRMALTGSNHLSQYAGSDAIYSFTGTTLTLSGDGLVITQLLPQAPIDQYLNKMIFLDIDRSVDMAGNQPARKGVPLIYYGSLFFSESVTNTISDSYATNTVDSVTAHLYSVSLTNTKDNLLLTMKASSGESEQIIMSESDNSSGYYSASFPIAYLKSFRAGNKVLEGVYSSPLKNDTTHFSTAVSLAGKQFTAPLSLTYTGGSNLYIKNSDKIITQQLSDLDSLFYTCFDTDSEKLQSSYLVSIRSADHGDVEEVILNSSFDIDNESSDLERTVLAKVTPFICSDILRPTNGNGIVETSADDTVYLSWINPFDPSDAVFDTVLIKGTPIIFSPLKAVVVDTNENGSADGIQVRYNQPLPEPFLYKSLYWNSTSVMPVTEFISLWYVDSSEYLTFDESAVAANCTGPNESAPVTSQAIIELMEQDFFNIALHSCKISDGMGAVPIDAKVLGSHRNSLLPDTLRVKVSEALFTTPTQIVPAFVRSCTPNQVLNPLSAISGYENSLPLSSLNQNRPTYSNSDSTFTILLPKGDPQAAKGNYLFLNQESGYSDKALNKPARKRVPLKRYEKLYFAFPDNPDSAIDLAEWPNNSELMAILPVESSSELIETLNISITLPTGDSELITLTETSGISGTFTGLFTFTFTASATPQNGLIEALFDNPDVDDMDTIKAHVVTVDGVESFTDLPVKYNAPPRIISALYYPADLDNNLPDTLVLTSNVPVSWPSSLNPILYPTLDYWNGLTNSQDMSVASIMDINLNGSIVTATTLIPRESALTPILDSIRFIPGTEQITTEAGILPIEASYIAIRYGKAPTIKVEAVPTPFTPGLSVIPELFKSHIPDSPEFGCGLRVRSRMKLASASYTIMDGTSNTVIAEIPLYIDESMNNLYGAWDAKNNLGRTVGNGAYLVLFRVEDILGNQYRKRLMVGIKEPYIPRTMPWDH